MRGRRQQCLRLPHHLPHTQCKIKKTNKIKNLFEKISQDIKIKADLAIQLNHLYVKYVVSSKPI